jgi:hypothetical protein
MRYLAYCGNGVFAMNKEQRKQAKKRKERQKERQQLEHQNALIEDRQRPGAQTETDLRQNDKTGKPVPTHAGRPHPITITLGGIAILIASLAFYWNVTQPDIRYIPSLGPETMIVTESKVDGSGNFVHYFRLRPTFTNYSIKPGFIDKAEFVPESITTLPDIKITSINKTFIYWHKPKQIEITFLMTLPTDAMNNLNTTRELAIDQVLAAYDNTGKKVDRLPNGMFGRIRFTFKDLVTILLKGIK